MSASNSSCCGRTDTTTAWFLTCGAPRRPVSNRSSWPVTPERFFRPPYVGGRGWLGVRLDGRVVWDEVEMLCEEAYRVVAPRRLLADARRPPSVTGVLLTYLS